MNFVTIATFSTSIEASPYISNLEHEGIKCFLKDEHTVTTAPIYEFAVGGIKLQVPEEDQLRAKEIMTEAGYKFDNTNELPAFWRSFDRVSKNWPIVGKWNVAFRFAIIIAIVSLLLILLANATYS